MIKRFLSKKNIIFLFGLLSLYFLVNCQQNEENTLLNAVIVICDEKIGFEKIAAQVLSEEVEKRTGNIWEVTSQDPVSGNRIYLSINIATHGDKPKSENYRLKIDKIRASYHINITGSDERGLLYGIGKFLRMLEWEKGFASIKSGIDLTSSPKYPFRGHQLGYRNRANSWDAWTPAQFEQYIRELALFGANSIENIPFEDDTESPHMKFSRAEMNIILSEICEKYDLDYWVWTPADFDLKDEIKRENALKKHELFYKASPRLSAVFFPGGDPGHNPAPILIPYLVDLSELLSQYHPDAKIWLSLQWFGDEDINYLFRYIESEKPKWLGGLVSGPGGQPVDDTRRRLPKEYKLRHYPDITHTVRCQYPVEWWDQAYELTLGREPINPRPVFYTKIHNKTAPFTDGFIAYSDGVHDDVNKIVYLEKGWDPEIKVNQIISDYTRFFFGSSATKDASRGIIQLEANWTGALKTNISVEKTLELWNKLEEDNPNLTGNWRWQMNLLRANYDAYTRRRLIYEEDLENEANVILGDFENMEIPSALDSAMVVINKNVTNPVERELRIKIEKLCDDLFQSIGLQTSVKKYQASGWERGCVLDYVDAPLNNREWFEYHIENIRKMENRENQIAAIKRIISWENPGEGSYYDNIGKVSQSPHVVRKDDKTPGFGWFGKLDGPPRLSTKVYIEQPEMKYGNLDPDGDYKLRAAGFGEALLRVNGKRILPVLYNKGYEEFKEFLIPKELYSDGKIDITWDKPDESHLNWRYQSFISDVWLLKL